MNEGAVSINTATWSGRSAASAALRPLMFRRTNSFELSDLEIGKASVRNNLFVRRDISLAHIISTGHQVRVEETDQLTYLKVHQGQAEIAIGDKVVIARAGQGVLLGPGPRKTKVEKHKAASYEATALLLPKSLLSDLDLDLDGRVLGKLLDQISGEFTPVSDATEQLDGCMWYTTRHLLGGTSAPLSVPVAKSAEELLVNLFSETILEILRHGQPVTFSGNLKKVREAEEFMRANLHQGLQLADLSKAVGVSARSLQIAFQDSRGISPTTSLQRIRLEEIHRRLADKANDKSVTEIAYECGWTHLGRLSAAFKQRFGQSPSVIRRKARST